jgi:hypothetical protein
MFIPLISSQGEKLSLLKTAEIEKNITQLLNQSAAFRMLFSGVLCPSVVIS